MDNSVTLDLQMVQSEFGARVDACPENLQLPTVKKVNHDRSQCQQRFGFHCIFGTNFACRETGHCRKSAARHLRCDDQIPKKRKRMAHLCRDAGAASEHLGYKDTHSEANKLDKSSYKITRLTLHAVFLHAHDTHGHQLLLLFHLQH